MSKTIFQKAVGQARKLEPCHKRKYTSVEENTGVANDLTERGISATDQVSTKTVGLDDAFERRRENGDSSSFLPLPVRVTTVSKDFAGGSSY
jgi:hypothetical protein